MSAKGFLQDVFDEISLSRNQELWCSTDDDLTEQRIRFLSEYAESEFSAQLQRSRSPLGKNEKLAQLCLRKCDGNEGDPKAISFLNQALLLAESPDTIDGIYAKRAGLLHAGGFPECSIEDLDCISNERQADAAAKKLRQEAVAKLQRQKPPPNRAIEICGKTSLRTDATCGRFVVADADISPGEVVAADAPALRMPNGGRTKTHCWHCLRRASPAAHPCAGCSGVVFCSRACSAEAIRDYHTLECGKTDLLFSSNIGVWNLAFREAAKRRKNNNVGSDERSAAIDGLVTHYGSGWYVAPELMKEALVAVFLTRALTGARGVLEGDGMEAATTVHRLMRAVRFNCHEVLEGYSVDGEVGSPPARVGFALNPNLAMINHSCDPNIGRVWLDGADHVIALATRPIKKGEEIQDSYSGVFSKADIGDRIRDHQRYHFECRCVACAESWPTLSSGAIESRVAGLGAEAYRGAGPVDGKKLKRLSRLADKALRPTKDLEQSVGLHEAALSLGHELLRPPHSLLLSLEDNFHRALWKYFTGKSQKCVMKVKPYSGHVADCNLGELG